MGKRMHKAGQGRGSRRGKPNKQVRCEPLESRRLLTGGFTDLGNLGLPGAIRAGAEWGDYDNDGDLDVAIAGNAGTFPTTTPFASVFRNDNGSYVNINAGLTPVFNGTLAWGDYDKDGDLDLLVTGRPSTGSIDSSTKLYRNDNGSFVDIQAPLVGVRYSSVDWGDYDNDGDLDILLAGRTGSNNLTNQLKLYRNDGGSFTDVNASLPGLSFGDVQWGDYDGDGDLDIFASGTGTSGVRVTQILRNDGNAVFTNISAALTPVNNSSVDWGDYDNDGDLDLLLIGQEGTGQPRSDIYRNDGAGVFTNINAGMTGLFYGAAKWGDYDNDGDLDALMSGRTGSSPAQYIARLYRNNGSAGFAEVSAGLPGADVNAIQWGDYDNDGDLDVLHVGRFNGNTPAASILRNDATAANSVPNAPTGLGATVLSPTQLQFSWTAPNDAQTPTPGLSYNLRVGTTPGGSDVVAPSALSTGKRTISQRGNVQGTSFVLNGLTPGQTYYWSVQAIDSAFAGSGFAAASQQTLPKLDQSINFTPPTSPIQFVPNQQVALVATGGASGNPVVFSIDPTSTGTGSISGDILTITAPGTFVINANQAGSQSYNPAPQVQRTLVVLQESLVVTTIVDENDGTSDVTFGTGTSLREAIAYANANPGADTITFASSLAGQTITLSQGWNGPGDDTALRVSSDLTIDSDNAITLTTAAAGRRIFLSSGGTFTLRDITLADADTRGVTDGAALWTNATAIIDNVGFTGNKANSGGAIQNFGSVTVTNSTFTGNISTSTGGAIDNGSSLSVTGSLFFQNSAGNGGAINSANGLTVERSTFSSNDSDFNGGALRLFGTSSVTGSTFTNNTADNAGGALISHGDTTLTNVTIAFNVAVTGGGVQFFEGSASLNHVTVAYNNASGNGGGTDVNVANVTATNTIIAGNTATAQSDASGAAFNAASSNNLVNLSAAAAGLGQIASLGGDTQTIPLTATSPAINAGTGSLATDQRGIARPQIGGVDIGAFEARVSDLNLSGVTTPDGAFWFLLTAFGNDLRIYRQAPGQPAIEVGGLASFIGLQADGNVVVRTSAGAVFTRPNSVGGVGDEWSFRASTVAGDNATWFLGTDGTSGNFNAYRWNDDGSALEFAGGAGTRLGAAGGVIVTETISGDVFYRNGSNAGLGDAWVQAARTAAGDGATWFVLAPAGNSGSIYRWEANASPVDSGGIGISLATTPAGDVRTVTAGGQTFQRIGSASGLGTEWRLLSESLVVTTIFDENDFSSSANLGNGTSLREAIDFANANPGPDTITFAPGLIAAGQAVELAFGATGAADDIAIRVTSDLTIDGSGATISYIGATGRRLFASFAGNTLTLRNLTLTGGSSTGGGGAVLTFGDLVVDNVRFQNNNAASGGAIRVVDGVTTVANSAFANNTASGTGGAIDNSGQLTITGSSFTVNSAGEAGAIQNTGTLDISTSTFASNASGFNGGALRLFGTTTITGSTFDANTVFNEGGALISFGNLTVTNSTFANNGKNAVLLWEGTADLRNITVAYNTDGGLLSVNADTTLRNSLVAGNAGFDQIGTLNAVSSNNLLNVSAAAAGLGTLADHGGATQTIAILPGSPAIDAGVAISGINADQRGITRPQGNASDIGAFESRGFTLQLIAGNDQSSPLNPNDVGNAAFGEIQIEVLSAFGEPVIGGVVTMTGPATGASISPVTLQTVIGADGIARFTPRPNGIAGTYALSVATAGAQAPVEVTLTNTYDAVAPSTVALLSSSDTGAFNNDGVTRLNNSSAAASLQFAVDGTMPGMLIRIYANDILIGSATATGTQTIVTTDGITALPDGVVSITATQTLPGYPESSPTPIAQVTIDTAAPVGTWLNGPAGRRVLPVDAVDLQTNEVIYGLTAADLLLTRDSIPVVLSGVTISFVGGQYRIDGLAPFTTARGSYTLGIANPPLATDLAGNALVDPSPLAWRTMILGDMNDDGVVNNLDIAPFVLGLTSPASFEASFGYSAIIPGDINADGAFNNLDIAPFVSLLPGGRTASSTPPSTGRVPMRAPMRGPGGLGLFGEQPIGGNGRSALAVLQ